MGLPVIYRAAAQADAAEAYHWYEEKQQYLGTSFFAELGETEDLISDNPELYMKIRGEVRRAVIHKFPYSIFYIARSDFISVIAVMRHSRNPDLWRSRS